MNETNPTAERVSRSATVDAPAAELFAIVADPRRHHELDGSGTVGDNVSGPSLLSSGAKFGTKMKMFGVPYRITSTVTKFEPDRLIEWRHPMGHRWRWEFEPVDATHTLVTETFDYRGGSFGIRLLGFDKRNATGIQATLDQLQTRYGT